MSKLKQAYCIFSLLFLLAFQFSLAQKNATNSFSPPEVPDTIQVSRAMESTMDSRWREPDWEGAISVADFLKKPPPLMSRDSLNFKLKG